MYETYIFTEEKIRFLGKAALKSSVIPQTKFKRNFFKMQNKNLQILREIKQTKASASLMVAADLKLNHSYHV